MNQPEYNPPEDNGKFFPQHDFSEFDVSSQNGIMAIDKPNSKLLKPYNYFVSVGGGYQGFVKLANARKFNAIPY